MAVLTTVLLVVAACVTFAWARYTAATVRRGPPAVLSMTAARWISAVLPLLLVLALLGWWLVHDGR
jgi:hypothetical protein